MASILSPREISVLGTRFDPVAVVMTLCAGALGGVAARLAGAPVPMLLGSLTMVAVMAMTRVKVLGRAPELPRRLRMFFVPAIGLSIGGTVTPAILDEARAWWPSLLALFVFIPVVHYLGFRLTTATSRLDPATAFFGSAPGGLIESVQMGEEMGADVRLLAMMQFLRLILTVVSVPIAFTWLTGHAVGSAAGVSPGPHLPLTLRDGLILVAAGVIGVWGGLRLHLPAAVIIGPVVMSGLVHGAGIVETVPPAWMLMVTQVVVGATLGVRFIGMPLHYIFTSLRLSVMNVALIMVCAGISARLLAPLVHVPPSAVFLAYAPGGIAEMGLIALSMHISALYVTAHHILRIALSITCSRFLHSHIGMKAS